MSKLLFVTLATPNYLPMAKQLFASAHNAGYWQGDYMLLTSGITASDREWFESRGIRIKDVPYSVSDATWNTFSYAKEFHRVVQEKFHLFTPEFQAWDIIVYMDCDIIVLAPLIRLESITGFNATADSLVFLKYQFTEAGQKALNASGYNGHSIPFCSGMFAFETKLITEDMFATLQRLSDSYLPLATRPDQAVLNLMFHQRWKKLSHSYAFMTRFIQSGCFSSRASSAIAVHLAGPRQKPWDAGSPYHTLWQRNLASAEHTDFKTPLPVTIQTRSEAAYKDIGFISWWLLAKRSFIRCFEQARWYPWFKRVTDRQN